MEFIKRANTFIYFKEVIFLFYLFPFSYINDIIATKDEQSKFHYVKGDTEGFVNIPLQMKGVVFSFSP